jgi:hypothetical protein
MMAGRGGSTRWAILLVIVGLLVCVGIVAVCFFRDASPSPSPSGSTLSGDSHDSQSAAETRGDAVGVGGHASREPNEGMPEDSNSADEDSGPLDSPASQALTGRGAEKAISPAPGLVLQGCVVYQDGTPYQETMGSGEMLRVHVTAPGYRRVCEIGAEGRFECTGLGAGSYTVVVVDAMVSQRIPCGGAQIEVRPDAASEEVVLVLGQEVPVVVRVLDEQSLTPSPDCSVAVQSIGAVAEASGDTDAQGLSEFSLIGGQYRFSVSRSQEGRLIEVASRLVLVRPTDGAVTVELLLPAHGGAKGMIRGVFVDAAGNPVEGYVLLEYTPHETSGEVGHSFAIAEPDRQPPAGVLGCAWDVSGGLGRRFLWRKGDPNEELTLVLEPHTSIIGYVVGVDRKPISNVRLDLQIQMLDGTWRGADDTMDTPVIDSEGYFAFDRIPVGLKVKVAAHQGTLSGQSRRMTLTPGEPVDAGQIVMTGRRPGAGIIEGRITDEMGESLADRAIQVRIGRSAQWLRTNGGGYFQMTDMPEGQPITVTIEVDPYGSWSRTAIPDDYACNFQLSPQGWDVVGKEAPPLFTGKWFNHVPMTLEELRGRVVLLAFRSLDRDVDPGLARIRNLQNEFGPRGLLVVAIYNCLPSGSPLAEDIVAEHLLKLLEGAPMAGLLDADPALVADLMPAERPAGAAAGATHWMYQVHTRPAFFLIDKAGKVRHCTGKDVELSEWIQRLLGE